MFVSIFHIKNTMIFRSPFCSGCNIRSITNVEAFFLFPPQAESTGSYSEGTESKALQAVDAIELN